MGDVHFVIRHSLTGFVFLVFLLLGLWITHDWASALQGIFLTNAELRALVPVLVTIVVTLFLSTPVIGVIVQGLYTAYMYIFSRAFTDEARKKVADHIRNEVIAKPVDGMAAGVQQSYRCAFQNMPADSIFVWLYYTDNQAHLVDWARRRRSYHYLGVNWAIAAILGIIMGLLLPWFASWEKASKVLLLAAISLGWIAGTVWLAAHMKRDVDCMELTWACSRIYPRFRELACNSWAVQQWAYGLKSAFATQPDKKPEDLAIFLGVAGEQVNRWMEKRDRVPPDVQNKIAAWFGIDRRQLFSDQP